MVIQQNSRKLLMMDILMSETCWVYKKWNKIASDIKMDFYSSTRMKLLNSAQLYYSYYLAITTVPYIQLHFAWYIISLVSNSKLNVMLLQTVTSTHGTAVLVCFQREPRKKALPSNRLLLGTVWNAILMFTEHAIQYTWCIQVLRSPNFFFFLGSGSR